MGSPRTPHASGYRLDHREACSDHGAGGLAFVIAARVWLGARAKAHQTKSIQGSQGGRASQDADARRWRSFTAAEARTILKAAWRREPQDTDREKRRWVPWLCAYSGARPGEITQLRGMILKSAAASM